MYADFNGFNCKCFKYFACIKNIKKIPSEEYVSQYNYDTTKNINLNLINDI